MGNCVAAMRKSQSQFVISFATYKKKLWLYAWQYSLVFAK